MATLVGMYWFFIIAFYVVNGLAFMRLAKIAGRPEIGWMAWVPIASLVQQLLLIQKSGWWVFIYLVPFVNIIFFIIWNIKLLEAFGKSGAFVLFGVFIAPVYEILWIVWAFSEKTQYMLPIRDGDGVSGPAFGV